MNSPNESSKELSGRPIIFGEVLFDHFPDGKRILGGAPFNVAWHLQGFGLSPLFISRVGDDDEGSEILTTMKEWGMDTSGLQQDSSYPTGQVEIKIDGPGQHSFEILADQAYDHINFDQAKKTVNNHDCSLIYYGSLINRNEVSQNSLHNLIQETNLSSFIDINLRSPWWSLSDIQNLIKGANWLKLNEMELFAILKRENLAPVNWKEESIAVCRKYGIDLLIITLGEDGAFMASPEDIVKGRKVKVDNIQDTVGAGDAFASVVILGLIKGWPFKDILIRALEFAASICGIRGATSQNTELYSSLAID